MLSRLSIKSVSPGRREPTGPPLNRAAALSLVYTIRDCMDTDLNRAMHAGTELQKFQAATLGPAREARERLGLALDEFDTDGAMDGGSKTGTPPLSRLVRQETISCPGRKSSSWTTPPRTSMSLWRPSRTST